MAKKTHAYLSFRFVKWKNMGAVTIVLSDASRDTCSHNTNEGKSNAMKIHLKSVL